MVEELVFLDEDVKEILDLHEDKIHKIESDVKELKLDINDLKEGQKELMGQFLSSHNAILQSANSTNQMMSQLIINMSDNKTQKEITQDNNQTQIEITKENNKSGLIKQLLIVLASLFAGSEFSKITGFFKDLF